ncbi:MAG: VWA domain-containing protein [Myxococcales bacterium]|nr:VWA domain-containing protein [Myxococcales bacterium]
MNRWLRALLPYGLLVAIGGPLALILRDYYRDPSRHAGALSWAHPQVWVLSAAGLLLAWVGFHLGRSRGATMGFSRVGELSRAGGGVRSYLTTLPTVLRIVALGAVIVALARPQTYRTITREVDSIDIMIVLDMSKSMEETDMARGDPLVQTDRLDAAQRVIRRFIAGRHGDRVGLTVFAQQTMLQCPLTLDMKILDQVVADLALDDIPAMGTAIGDGLGLGLASLRRSDAKSKIVILLSDGENNVSTQMTPQQAAEVAFDDRVKVFTVLVGAEDGPKQFGNTVNPATLRNIAQVTGGMFFKATDFKELENGFETVRKELDKTRRVEKERKKDAELWVLPLAIALALLCLDALLARTWLRRFP